MSENKKSVRRTLLEMKVGEHVVFSLDILTTVRAACSNYGLQWDRKFVTESNREERTITVTRTY